MTVVKAVIPAAGEGSRLEPLTSDRPKGLVEIAGRPLLSYVFGTAVEAGAGEIVVVVGENGRQIRDRFGSRFDGVPLTYVRQPEPRGLGDAVSWAEEQVDGTFVVLNGDNVFAESVRPAVRSAEHSQTDGVLLVEKTSRDAARETGVVTIEDGEIASIVEKPDDPRSTFVTTGCYVLPPAMFHALELARPSDRGEIELSEAVELLIAAGYTVEPVEYTGERVNVNRPADIETAETLVDG